VALLHVANVERLFLYNCVLPDDGPIRAETCSSWCGDFVILTTSFSVSPHLHFSCKFVKLVDEGLHLMFRDSSSIFLLLSFLLIFLPKNMKIRIDSTVILGVIFCGCAAWSLTLTLYRQAQTALFKAPVRTAL
jgi:hypothetical protein